MTSEERTQSITKCNISWNEVHQLVTQLVNEIKPNRRKLSTITAIANGGNIPAAMLAYHLNLHLEVIDEPPMVNEQPTHLLFDDVCDNGKTFIEYTQYTKWAATATLIRKPWSRFVPTFNGKISSDWIIFPWEVQV